MTGTMQNLSFDFTTGKPNITLALNERQEIENKILNKEADGSGMLHRFGLHNDAEVQKMKQQQQEEEQKQIESIMNEENGPLYN